MDRCNNAWWIKWTKFSGYFIWTDIKHNHNPTFSVVCNDKGNLQNKQ